MSIIQEFIQNLALKLGYQIISTKFPKDMDKEFKKIYVTCKNYTMTSIERMYSVYKAVKYITVSKIPGDLVECGVWRGGISMVMAYTLLSVKEKNRKIYLYDTFGGMTQPSEKDKRIYDSLNATKLWKKRKKWCFTSLNEVEKNILSTGYPKEKLVFVKGKVEDTIPKTIPKKISILRLDTDWYRSTYHELKYLFPLLSKGGVLILDDYGHWAGVKAAADKYLKEKNISILLNRVDYSSRTGIKL
jgi:hypothetical protein